MAISLLKIRRPLGRLIFNMGIAIPGKTVFLIETAPWSLYCDVKLLLKSVGTCYQLGPQKPNVCDIWTKYEASGWKWHPFCLDLIRKKIGDEKCIYCSKIYNLSLNAFQNVDCKIWAIRLNSPGVVCSCPSSGWRTAVAPFTNMASISNHILSKFWDEFFFIHSQT